ncbi:serine/threonine-protein kinase [Hyalangium versicolor]|uniref:serine/threonine-protein kinase n=1 Tax=Hyalangium versicolor TaxID=2861190 RepID=UPI001CCC5CC7|nr:serine/threonine-protein kinase [Hyalangium versicolor]
MTDAPTPDSLRPGSLVGPWRVETYAGGGTYGVVYRARRAGHPGSVPVALKVARFPHDPRFFREVELLMRSRHPGIPELLDRGWWLSSEGITYPYLVMEWIHGAPLYEWARVHKPSSRKVLQVLAQVAWGLEVVHQTGGLHRDVKGDNILVEPEGRAFLTDFGSGTWAGASPLTESLMPPGTREYRGPEALRYQWHHLRQRGAHYAARSYDDLYALGVTAYRLVTGRYPPPGTDPEAKMDPIRSPPPPREPSRALNPRVIPELSELIERMLSAEPETRGLAREIAEAAEAVAEHAGPEADVPLEDSVPAPASSGARLVSVRWEPMVQKVVSEQVPAEEIRVPVIEPTKPHVETRLQLRGLVSVAMVLLTMACILWMGHGSHPRIIVDASGEVPDIEALKDDDAASLADASVTTRVTSQSTAVASASISLDMPTDPLPGQLRAPCRRRGAVEINGGCWIRWADLSPPCGEDAYEWKGICYWPIYDRTRPPTTKKPHEPKDQ